MTLDTWIGIGVGAVISVILSGIFYHLSKKDKLPRYAKHSINHFAGLSSSISSIKVHYQGYGEDIDTLTITKIVFWNAGRETITKTSIVEPITVGMKGNALILDIEIIEVTSGGNGFAARKNQERTKATVDFKYLDHKQYAVIQVIHTGSNGDAVELTGEIMGSNGVREWTAKRSGTFSLWFIFIYSSVVIGLVTIFISVIFPDTLGKPNYHQMVFTMVLFTLGFFSSKLERLVHGHLYGKPPRSFDKS